jgi:hypothetical protein
MSGDDCGCADNSVDGCVDNTDCHKSTKLSSSSSYPPQCSLFLTKFINENQLSILLV